MNMLLISCLTSLSILLIIYHHAGYPLLLHFLSNRMAREDALQPCSDRPCPSSLPSITVVVPAYNEAQFIADKIRNLAMLDYPADSFQIIIASDGSTDATYEIAVQALQEPECSHCAIKVVKFAQNRGKIPVLNDVVSAIESDIVAFTDVSALISMDALLLAERRFRDPTVGVVNGRYQLLNPGSAGEKKYWEYQSRLKTDEARLGSVIGSHGAFYLIRTHLFRSLPSDTINDDFIIPMRIVEQGYRSVYDPDINALELEQAQDSQDSQRRQRISAGNLQQAFRMRSLLLPKYRGTAFTFASGKVLRVAMPYLMITALLGSLWLSTYHSVFLMLASAQVAIYTLYFSTEILRIGGSFKPLQILKYLLRGHINGLKGSADYMKGSLLKSFSK
jgi:cellulose synthase/poly-beta-1,6-N-acetylglucosamine synthase-like glycosyltransferase